jgi:hypothetical protein
MSFMYCLRVWFLSNLLHPVCLWLYFSSTAEHENFSLSGLIGFYFMTILLSLSVSLPALAFTNLLMRLILYFKITDTNKFILWLLLAPCIALLNWIGFFFALGEYWIRDFEWDLMLPSAITVLFVILISYKSFFNLLNEQEHEKNDLV